MSKSYDEKNFEASFWADLRNRIKKEYRKTNHNYKQTVRKQFWRWKMLARFAKYREKDSLVLNSVYTKTTFTTQLFWKIQCIVRIALAFGWAVFYSILFFATEGLIGWLENIYEDYSKLGYSVFFENSFQHITIWFDRFFCQYHI